MLSSTFESLCIVNNNTLQTMVTELKGVPVIAFKTVISKLSCLLNLRNKNSTCVMLKVCKFQNESLKSWFLPKYERKTVRISILYVWKVNNEIKPEKII